MTPSKSRTITHFSRTQKRVTWRAHPSVSLSVTQNHLNCFSNFHEIRCTSSSRKVALQEFIS